MEERELVVELLAKAVEKGVISEAQSRFYRLRYDKKELSFERLQQEIAQTSSTRQYQKKSWPYRFVRSLGRGGMGEVFAATHKDTGDKVAIKKIRFYALQDEQAQENAKKRFLRECSLQEKLDHPNVVRVCDYGAYGTQLFLVTPLIEGDTLQNIVAVEKKSGTFFSESAPHLLQKMIDICDAIHCAHRHGIIHRDINPRNIMLDYQQKMWIMDFGLAKRFDVPTTQLTRTNELLGTPSYMSPEQWEGNELGPLSDVYSLGATLFFAATGEPPHPEEPTAVLYNMVNRIPANPIKVYCSDLPEMLDAVIHKAMAYEAAERYQDAAALGEALRDCLEDWKKNNATLFAKIKKFLHKS